MSRRATLVASTTTSQHPRWNAACYVPVTMMCTAIALAVLAATTPAESSGPEPDLAIITNVRARELRFEVVPDVRVQVFGSVNGQPAVTVDRTDRNNLPEQVQPHVTYRDIGIRLTITSTLPDIERILDEALGTNPNPQP